MTVTSSTGINFSPGDVRHRHTPSYSTLEFGDHATDAAAHLFFEDAAAVDAVIAELVALRAEMTAPVITDSERTCGQANPASGAWCRLPAPHDDHRDTDGDTWTTAGHAAVAS